MGNEADKRSIDSDIPEIIYFAADESEDDDSGWFQGMIDGLQNLWTSLQEIRMWLEDRDRENSDKLADFLNIDSQLRGSHQIGNQDGTISLLLKGQIGRLESTLRQEFYAIDEAISMSDTQILFGLKGLENKIFNQLVEMNDDITDSIADLDESIAFNLNWYLRDYLGVANTDDVFLGTITGGDSPIIKQFKYQFKNLRTNLDNNFSASNDLMEDSFTELADSITFDLMWYLREYLGVANNDDVFLGTITGGDSPIIKQFKYQFKNLRTNLDNNFSASNDLTEEVISTINGLPELLAFDLNWYLREWVGTANQDDVFMEIITGSDSYLIKQIKYQSNRIVEALDGVGGGGPSDGLEKALEPITDLLDDIKEGIKDITIVNEAGTNIWDFLTGLTDGIVNIIQGILDFLENLMDFLTNAIVPKDTEFVNDFFSDLNEQIDSKFAFAGDLQMLISNSFAVEQKQFTEDYYVSFPQFGTIKVMETDVINEFLPTIRQMLSGLMILLTAVWAYRKVTGTGGIVE